MKEDFPLWSKRQTELLCGLVAVVALNGTGFAKLRLNFRQVFLCRIKPLRKVHEFEWELGNCLEEKRVRICVYTSKTVEITVEHIKLRFVNL